MLFYFLFPVFSAIVLLIAFSIYLRKTCEFSHELSHMEVEYYQNQIDSEQRYQDLIKDGSSEVAAQRLGLILTTPQENNVIDNYDSILCPTKKDGFNGEIVCKEDKDYNDIFGANFRRYHEIIHYVDDVGIGNPVRKKYAKDPTGETRSHREQIVNFKAAAVAIPKSSLLQDLNSQESTSYYDNEFLKYLQKKYQQPIQTITRRIYEVAPRD